MIKGTDVTKKTLKKTILRTPTEKVEWKKNEKSIKSGK